MSAELVAFLVGSVCFGVSTVLGIRLRDGLTVPIAAALAPAVAAVSLSSEPSASLLLVLVAPGSAVIALTIARAPVLEIGSHAVLFLAVAAGVRAAAGDADTSTRLVAVALVATFAYSIAEVGRQKITQRGGARISSDSAMWWLLQGVLICACGLTVLVVDRMGWAAFVAMAVVLGLTRREFQGFALSRTALDQTVRVLERLSAQNDERSGIAH